MATHIEFWAETVDNRVNVTATVGGTRTTSTLMSVALKDGEDERDAAVRAVQDLFDWSDFAEQGEVADLADEFRNHTHGSPS